MFETTHFDDMEFAMRFIESLAPQGHRHVSDGLVRSKDTGIVHVIVTWERGEGKVDWSEDIVAAVRIQQAASSKQ